MGLIWRFRNQRYDVKSMGRPRWPLETEGRGQNPGTGLQQGGLCPARCRFSVTASRMNECKKCSAEAEEPVETVEEERPER